MTTSTHALRSFVLLSSAFLFCGLSGCIDSKHPLSDPEKAVVDPELLGTWLWQPTTDETQEWVVAKAGPGFPKGMLTLTDLGGGMKETGYMFTTTIGKDRYINVANFPEDQMPDRWDAKRVDYYTLMQYQINNGVFKSKLMSEDFFRKAVESRKLDGQGVFKDGDEIEFNLDAATEKFALTASTEQLRKFFVDHRKELLGDEGITATRKPKPKPPSKKADEVQQDAAK